MASSPPCVLDEEYYWELIKFSAEDHVFRVPKHRFMTDSETFATAHGLGFTSLASEDDFSAENPLLDAIHLDVTAHEFRVFLKALYPKQLQGELTLSTDEWFIVLKLSTNWLFNELRKLAIEKLSPLAGVSSFEQVHLGEEFNVEAWLLSGYRQLVKRDPPITIEEAEKLGWQNAIKLCALREGWTKHIRSESNWRSAPEPYDLNADLKSAFSEKFEAIREAQPLYITTEERLAIQQERELAEKEAKDAAERMTQEERTLAEREADRARLELAAAAGRARVEELAKELEEHKRLLEALDCDMSIADTLLHEASNRQSGSSSLPDEESDLRIGKVKKGKKGKK
ncbi:hypothetical protein DFP72DRAFT_1089646 [Ephemerocybe angulata]|uniref:BTB domain-containing protein n=1 Tax=Ephemerocybe angulata TaxID=980116 RepID=A0A8H6IB33_9AGAR|nr:hypothetical protein DFP72DRAFT_1089646 [Tulosesus angulatus]